MFKFKHLTILLLALVCNTTVLMASYVYKPFEINGIWYEVDNEEDLTVCVTRCSDYTYYKGLVNIPPTIEYENKTYTVTSIDHDAFAAQTELTSVVLPTTLKRIGYKAFQSAANLKSIAFSNKGELETIERNAFRLCRQLTSLKFPESVKTIGDHAFEDCTGLKSISFGNIESLEKAAFKGCDNLVEVDISDSVKSIGEMCFWGCSALRKVHIGSSVEYIGPDAFLDCHMLEDINLPYGLKELGYEAFRGCWNLTHMELPNSLTTMGYNVFKYCVSLKSIKLSENLTEIPAWAFEQTDLETITIPNSVKTIQANAFIECTKLREVKFGNGLLDVGVQAFLECTSLEEVILHEPLQQIHMYAFCGCKNLKFVSIPRTTWNIGTGAFSECPNLSDVNDLASVPQDIFDRVVFAQSGPDGPVNVHVYEGLYDIYSTTVGWYDIPASKYFCNINIIADLPVVPIQNITFEEDRIYCQVGEQKTASISLTPENAVSTELIWSSSDESILFVDMYSGEFIGISEGEVMLTVTVNDDRDVSASVRVIVGEDNAVESISANGKQAIIYDLYGRRLNNLQPGINIVDGKKILVK